MDKTDLPEVQASITANPFPELYPTMPVPGMILSLTTVLPDGSVIGTVMDMTTYNAAENLYCGNVADTDMFRQAGTPDLYFDNGVLMQRFELRLLNQAAGGLNLGYRPVPTTV